MSVCRKLMTCFAFFRHDCADCSKAVYIMRDWFWMAHRSLMEQVFNLGGHNCIESRHTFEVVMANSWQRFPDLDIYMQHGWYSWWMLMMWYMMIIDHLDLAGWCTWSPKYCSTQSVRRPRMAPSCSEILDILWSGWMPNNVVERPSWIMTVRSNLLKQDVPELVRAFSGNLYIFFEKCDFVPSNPAVFAKAMLA